MGEARPQPAPAKKGADRMGSERVGRLIREFSTPAIISLLANAIYNIVDQIFIGHGIGFLGIAATNVAFPLTTVSTAAALLVGVGGAANFSLNLGAGKRDLASHYVGNALSLLAVLGIGLGLISLIFVQPILVLFGSTQQVMPYALPYTAIVAVYVRIVF